jgi:hypothetical protein
MNSVAYWSILLHKKGDTNEMLFDTHEAI